MTKYLLIAVVALTMLLAGSGWLLKRSYEANGALEIALKVQRQETEKAIAEIASLKDQHAEQIELATAYQKELSRANTELRRRGRDIRATANSLQKALAREPVRTGRAATYLDRRSLREICRASGGSPDACKIAVSQPAAAGPGDPAAARSGAGQILAGKTSADGRPDVHAKPGLDRDPDISQRGRVLDAAGDKGNGVSRADESAVADIAPRSLAP